MIYIFDGTYKGFLTGIFESFERKHYDVTPVIQNKFSRVLFEEIIEISTDTTKAERVHKGLLKNTSSTNVQNFYKVFLSEKQDAHKALFYIIQHIFLVKKDILKNYGDANVLLFDKTLTSVNRERHRMKAFVRFQKSNNAMFHAVIEPDFNILPLIANFFRKRYSDQAWLIYDIKRKYGLLYDLNSVSEVQLSLHEKNSLSKPNEIINLDETEEHYQKLWQQYFKSTNIEARKNMKLHLQHVPRRYWKYLIEKN